jgi:glycosyltransferase involved in cell wall biosynthesis
LKLCTASVTDQEGVSHEHIVQDAGTGPDLEQWARSVPELSLYVEKDQGMYDAINRGLGKTRGNICSYLNCDEQYLPGALARVASFFDAHPEVDVLFGDAVLIDWTGNPISYRRIVLPTVSHVRYVHLNTQSCSMFFRRTLLEQGFFFDSNWQAISDGIWVERLLLSGIRMATMREPLAVFTFTGENLGGSSVSQAEAFRRRGQMSIPKQVVRLGTIVSHRLRKFLAGAYKTRVVEIEIYTLDSPTVRRRKCARVGFSWPNQ